MPDCGICVAFSWALATIQPITSLPAVSLRVRTRPSGALSMHRCESSLRDAMAMHRTFSTSPLRDILPVPGLRSPRFGTAGTEKSWLRIKITKVPCINDDNATQIWGIYVCSAYIVQSFMIWPKYRYGAHLGRSPALMLPSWTSPCSSHPLTPPLTLTSDHSPHSARPDRPRRQANLTGTGKRDQLLGLVQHGLWREGHRDTLGPAPAVPAPNVR